MGSEIWKQLLLLMNKNMRLMLIIQTLNTWTIPTSNLLENI
jgi:hypothetical protein